MKRVRAAEITGFLALLALVLVVAPALRAADTPTPAADAPAWLTSYDTAAKAARAQGKFILADFTGSDWCGWCMKLKKEVFDTPEFAKWAKENVILLEVDFPQAKPQTPELRSRNQALARKYNIEGFPTILFLDPDGKAVATSGYAEGGPSKWIAAVEKSLPKLPKVPDTEQPATAYPN